MYLLKPLIHLLFVLYCTAVWYIRTLYIIFKSASSCTALRFTIYKTFILISRCIGTVLYCCLPVHNLYSSSYLYWTWMFTTKTSFIGTVLQWPYCNALYWDILTTDFIWIVPYCGLPVQNFLSSFCSRSANATIKGTSSCFVLNPPTNREP